MKHHLIETERLVLREIALEDTSDMFRLHSNVEVQKFTGESILDSEATMAKKIRKRIADYPKYGYGRWATFLKHNMEFIGWSGLAYLPEFDAIDLGYRFLPEYWGKGLATEASLAILDYGFNTLNIETIIAIAMPENRASTRVMEKVGMRFDKLAPYDPGMEDVAWYSMSKSDFNALP